MSFFQFALTNILGFILLLLVVGIFVYGLLVFFRLYVLKSKKIKKNQIDLILVLGVIALVYGFLFQIIGMVAALDAVIEAADISPQMVLEGLKESFEVPILGMVLFISAVIIWYVNKIKWERNAALNS